MKYVGFDEKIFYKKKYNILYNIFDKYYIYLKRRVKYRINIYFLININMINTI